MRTGELVDNLAKLEFIDEVNGNKQQTHTYSIVCMVDVQANVSLSFRM